MPMIMPTMTMRTMVMPAVSVVMGAMMVGVGVGHGAYVSPRRDRINAAPARPELRRAV
jgi:hypothetical protein